MSQSLRNLEPVREFPVVHAHLRLHAVMELADNCDHLLRDTGSGQHFPQQLSVDRIVSLLEVNEAHVQQYSPPPRQFLKSTHYEQHVDGGSFRSEAALFVWQDAAGFAVVAEAVGYYFQTHFACVREK